MGTLVALILVVTVGYASGTYVDEVVKNLAITFDLDNAELEKMLDESKTKKGVAIIDTPEDSGRTWKPIFELIFPDNKGQESDENEKEQGVKRFDIYKKFDPFQKRFDIYKRFDPFQKRFDTFVKRFDVYKRFDPYMKKRFDREQTVRNLIRSLSQSKRNIIMDPRAFNIGFGR